MLYLQRFRLPEQAQEDDFLTTIKRTCYPSKYPFHVFRCRRIPELEFAPITIFYGGNGSGKSTLLNVMAERLRLDRGTVCNKSPFFSDYAKLCAAVGKPPRGSRIVTSDDVFEYLLNIRYLHENLDNEREKLLAEYRDVRYAGFQMQSMADYEELKKHVDAARLSGSQYAKSRLMEAAQEQSNGESALQFFTRTIQEQALYLLDEPENSLSAQKQLELRQFLSDSVRFFGCQFVISTHSPFLLSLPEAKIYDLDQTPPQVRNWTELESIQIYRDFFRAHEKEFSV